MDRWRRVPWNDISCYVSRWWKAVFGCTNSDITLCQRYLCGLMYRCTLRAEESENTRREGWHVWANVIATLYTPHQNIEQTDTVTVDYRENCGRRRRTSKHLPVVRFVSFLHSGVDWTLFIVNVHNVQGIGWTSSTQLSNRPLMTFSSLLLSSGRIGNHGNQR